MDDPAQPSLSVLIIEDNEPTLMVMRKLVTHMGHRVTTATSLAEAHRQLAAQEFHLVMSDLSLPDGSGIELFRDICPTRRPRAIVLSGYDTDDDLRQTREAGFDLHLTKPINFAQLKDAIDTAMKASR